MDIVYEAVRETLKQTEINYENHEPRVTTDDLVCLQAKMYAKGTSKKLQARYYGPHRIFKKIENNT